MIKLTAKETKDGVTAHKNYDGHLIIRNGPKFLVYNDLEKFDLYSPHLFKPEGAVDVVVKENKRDLPFNIARQG